MTLKAVLFDRDDTLCFGQPEVYLEAARWAHETFGVDPSISLQAMQDQWNSTAERWSHLRTLEDENQFWRTYGDELAIRLGEGPEVGQALVTHYPYWRFIRAFPEGREVLLGLRKRGLKIGVLSNTLPNIESTLQAIDLADLIDVPLASCSLGFSKPAPQAFLLSADRIGFSPNQILFIDDRLDNVQAACGVGMQGLHIQRQERQGFQPSGKHQGTISSLYGVLEYLDTLCVRS